jgi:hypothetical protein
MSITLEVAHPIVFTKFDGEQTLDDVEAYIRRFDEVHARRQPYVGITWMRRWKRGPAITERMGRWLKESEAATRALCLGAGLIATSATFRFALSAVFLVKPMVCPYVVCGTFDDALAFVRAQAQRGGLRLPSTVRSPWPELDALR